MKWVLRLGRWSLCSLMHKPFSLTLIVGCALGAFLIAMVGVSAHEGGLLNMVGIHQSSSDDHASSARTEPRESSEPSEKPESSAMPRSTGKPTSKPDTEPDEDDMPKASPTSTPTPHCYDEGCSSPGGGEGGGD